MVPLGCISLTLLSPLIKENINMSTMLIFVCACVHVCVFKYGNFDPLSPGKKNLHS